MLLNDVKSNACCLQNSSAIHSSAMENELQKWQAEDADRLKGLFKEHAKDSQMVFGQKFELGSQGMVWQYLNGRRPLNLSALLKFSKGLGVSPTEISPTLSAELQSVGPLVDKTKEIQLIHTDESDDFIAVQRADFKLSAGVTGYSIELLNGDRAPIFFRKDWLEKRGYRPDKLHAIAISGQSMETSMYDGDIVVINVDDIRPADGEVFAANYEGELVIKRMVRESGNWYLSSDNQDKRRFPNKLCHEDCFIIGRVIYKQSERI
jgi:phage repressor protein C with HTH and peptisase S24 domain